MKEYAYVYQIMGRDVRDNTHMPIHICELRKYESMQLGGTTISESWVHRLGDGLHLYNYDDAMILVETLNICLTYWEHYVIAHVIARTVKEV